MKNKPGGLADKAGDRLCAAVSEWVNALGGTPMVIGNVKLQAEKHRGRQKFTISVQVDGWLPEIGKYEIKKRTHDIYDEGAK